MTSVTAATWVATPVGDTLPFITKHWTDMYTGPDPEVVPSAQDNCIYIPIAPLDTGGSAEGVGQFEHELRITLNGQQSVVYPAPGMIATFSVTPSLTWELTPSPQPRLERIEVIDPKALRRDARRGKLK